jgi:hypothetical protein
MAFLDESAPDGLYLLDLRVAPLCLDAAPSSVLLFPLEEERRPPLEEERGP